MSEILTPPGVEQEVQQPEMPSYKRRASGELAPGDPIAKQIKALQALPSVLVTWDADKQIPRVIFDPADFKTWNMVVMVLKAALSEAEFNLQTARMQGLQQAMQQASVEQQVAQRILRPGR